jgi:hypothetical protein
LRPRRGSQPALGSASEAINSTPKPAISARWRKAYAQFRKDLEASNVSMQSVWLMAAVQLVMIAQAVYEQWPLSNVLLLYWSQNIVMGVFTVLRLLSWKNIVIDKTDHKMSKGERKLARYIAAFTFSFSFFVTHALILWVMVDTADIFGGLDLRVTFSTIRVAVLVFFAGQAGSFLLNHRVDSATLSTYNGIFNKAYILLLPLLMLSSICAPVLIIGVFVMFAAWLAGVDGNFLGAVGDTLAASFPVFVLVIFMLLKALMDLAAQMASYADMPVPE